MPELWGVITALLHLDYPGRPGMVKMYLGLADEAGVFLRKRIIDLDADGEDRVLITGPEFVFVATVRFRDRWVNSATFRAGMPDVPDPHVFITK